MIREIKFRAWDGKEMHTAFDLSQNPKYWWEENKDYPLMQYTGLLDKNGKEIYEGDILDWPTKMRSEQGVVEWIGQGWWLRLLDGTHHFPTFNIEIIGNIYENPELIEK